MIEAGGASAAGVAGVLGGVVVVEGGLPVKGGLGIGERAVVVDVGGVEVCVGVVPKDEGVVGVRHRGWRCCCVRCDGDATLVCG